ncbi:MAG: hypothetical protein P1P88_20090, partial [Bacteroidales bacterium]|nr:hypothetical protein [Bacteroidales bacterium]
MKIYLQILFFLVLWISTSCSDRQTSQQNITELKLNEKEYLHAPGMSVLAFHNEYPVGMQGYIEIIQYNNRIATNGNVFFEEVSPEDEGEKAQVPIPKIDNPSRIIDSTNNAINVPFRYEKLKLNYDINIIGKANGFSLNIKFLNEIDSTRVKNLKFRMNFFPEDYKNRTFVTNKNSGVFPEKFIEANKENRFNREGYLASGQEVILAPEIPELKLRIVSDGPEMVLFDERYSSTRL